MDRGQPKPGAFYFGSEEGLEDMRLGVGIHADSRVGHGQHDIPAWLHGPLAAGVALVEIRVLGLDRERSALRHGVARIESQIQNDLLKLARVCVDPPELKARMNYELYLFANQVME